MKKQWRRRDRDGQFQTKYSHLTIIQTWLGNLISIMYEMSELLDPKWILSMSDVPWLAAILFPRTRCPLKGKFFSVGFKFTAFMLWKLFQFVTFWLISNYKLMISKKLYQLCLEYVCWCSSYTEENAYYLVLFSWKIYKVFWVYNNIILYIYECNWCVFFCKWHDSKFL